jgi:hypothetical protein
LRGSNRSIIGLPLSVDSVGKKQLAGEHQVERLERHQLIPINRLPALDLAYDASDAAIPQLFRQPFH